MNSDEGLETLEWVEELLPAANWRSVLYIGWHPNTFGKWDGAWYLMHIRGRTRGAEPRHVIIERNAEYAKLLIDSDYRRRYKVRVVNADVCEYARTTEDRFDLVIWWHGPEHIPVEDLTPTLKALERICTGAVILGCPNGEDPYEDPEGDDRHYGVITDALLREYGYQTRLIDREWKGWDQPPSISAVKVCKAA